METDSSLHWTMMKLNLKENGNRSFGKKEYGDAAMHYSSALEIQPNDTDILSNRALAYINIGCFNLALADTERALHLKPTHEKCIFRKVKALWGLRKYEEAVKFLKTQILNDIQSLPLFTELIEKAEEMIVQSKGEFDMLEIMSLPKGKSVDIAEYTGPVKISNLKGRGRGLIATEDIEPGQLVICSKAFAIVFEEEDKNRNFKDITPSHKNILLGLICQKLSLNPELREEFTKLYTGPDGPREWEWDDNEKENPEEIARQVNYRVKYNCFGGQRDPNPLADEIVTFLGVWLLPSYLNHSCMDSNANWSEYGDMMLVRACRSIKAGEEVTIAYVSPEHPYRREMIEKVHQFRCDCRLCRLEREESAETKNEIEEILKKIRENLEDVSQWKKQVNRVQKLISLRSGNPTANLALLDPCVETVVGQVFDAEEWQLAADIFEKARDVCKNNTYVLNAVYMDMTILRCYLHLGDDGKINKWVQNIQQDLIAAYGSLEPLKVIGANIVSDMKEIGIDLFDLRRITITEI